MKFLKDSDASANRVVVAGLLVIVLFVCRATAVAANDVWPEFLGPDGDGVVRRDVDLPLRWSPDQNVRWRTELPGSGWSSPVVSDESIYLTAAIDGDGDAFRLVLLKVDAESGRLVETFDVMTHRADHPARMHSKNSHASPTPIVDGNRVYAHFGYQGTACLSTEGDVVWTNRELYFNPTHGNGGSPILVDGRLIFTCDGGKAPQVVALSAETGEVLWRSERPVSAAKTFSFCTPSAIEVDGQVQVIAPGSDCVQALDPQTGRTIWRLDYTGYSVVPKPIYHADLVLLSTGFDDSELLAIRPDGRGNVTDTHLKWQLDRNIPKTPSMVARDGFVFSISDNGIALCVDVASGEIRFRERVGGNFSASPILAGGHVYFTSEAGVTTVIRAGPQFEQIARNDLGERTLASPAVVGNALLLRTDKALYRLEAARR